MLSAIKARVAALPYCHEANSTVPNSASPEIWGDRFLGTITRPSNLRATVTLQVPFSAENSATGLVSLVGPSNHVPSAQIRTTRVARAVLYGAKSPWSALSFCSSCAALRPD